ncbi:hypothetical protein E3P96_03722 [Wallemia ichthyophaga]|nr:hypothetical protein E3P96_03722 [Wallemia ichthyophaga]
MSGDFYALFRRQPQNTASTTANTTAAAPPKKRGRPIKHQRGEQTKMNRDGTIHDATKKRKNSVIDIDGDEDEPDIKKQQMQPTQPSTRPLHPLFTSNYSQKSSEKATAKPIQQLNARIPSISESHVQPDGDRAIYVHIGEAPFKRREEGVKVAEQACSSTGMFKLASLSGYTSYKSDHSIRDKVHNIKKSQKTEQAQHSLITRTLAPKHPSQVLHNGTLATYLSAWMANLALGSPRWEDVRAGQELRMRGRKGKKDNEDNWIVDDMFDFDFDFDARVEPPSQPSYLPTLPRTHHPDSIESNCILLQGAPGSGKTAAVYAAAHALGWDVFEVFPGQRRSGKEVLDLVGAVGENHIIGGSNVKQHKRNTPKHSQHHPNPHKQSVIFLEEVDVIFEEDKGFWGAVQALAQYSKRPVVLTCNDASVIPSTSVILQTTLEFKRPPHDVVRRYMVECGGAKKESAYTMQTSHTQLTSLDPPPQVIEDDKSWLVDSAGGLYGKHFDDGCDLRQALMQLHVQSKQGTEENCSDEEIKTYESSQSQLQSHTNTPSNKQLPSLNSLLNSLEALSFVDAHVAQPLWRSMELLESETPNEIIGHETLGRITKADQTTLAEFTCEGDIGEYILDTVNKAQDGFMISPNNTLAHHAQQDILLDMRLDMLGAFAPIMPSAVLAVDYAPYIRQLVACDDEQERLAVGEMEGSSRGTRNSRNRYRRMYDFESVASIKGSYLKEG